MTKPTAVLTKEMARAINNYIPASKHSDWDAALSAIANDQARIAVRCEACRGDAAYHDRLGAIVQCRAEGCHNGWRVVSEGEGK